MPIKLFTVVQPLIDLFFPRLCVCCKEFTTNPDSICNHCHKLLDASVDEQVESSRHAIDTHIAYFSFNDEIRAVVHSLKYYNNTTAACELLRKQLRNSGVLSGVEFDLVEPVPLHWYRQLRRGYNQAQKLAKIVADECQVPLGRNLSRVRYTKSQTRKTKQARSKSVRNSFAPHKMAEDLSGKRVLLIDDVCTTGATAEQCAKVLREQGADEVYLLTLATVSPFEN